MTVSGDGFVTLSDGTLRWGRFGAAGVLARCADGRDGGDRSERSWWYFLARRSEWCHQGGCWAIDVSERFCPPAPLNWETAETGWFPHDRLAELELLGAFRRTLTRLGVLGEP